MTTIYPPDVTFQPHTDHLTNFLLKVLSYFQTFIYLKTLSGWAPTELVEAEFELLIFQSPAYKGWTYKYAMTTPSIP